MDGLGNTGIEDRREGLLIIKPLSLDEKKVLFLQ